MADLIHRVRILLDLRWHKISHIKAVSVYRALFDGECLRVFSSSALQQQSVDMLPGALFAVVLIGAFVVDGSEGAKIESFPIAANFNFKVTGPGDTLPARDRARFKTLFARQQAVEARQQGVGLKNAVVSPSWSCLSRSMVLT